MKRRYRCYKPTVVLLGGSSCEDESRVVCEGTGGALEAAGLVVVMKKAGADTSKVFLEIGVAVREGAFVAFVAVAPFEVAAEALLILIDGTCLGVEGVDASLSESEVAVVREGGVLVGCDDHDFFRGEMSSSEVGEAAFYGRVARSRVGFFFDEGARPMESESHFRVHGPVSIDLLRVESAAEKDSSPLFEIVDDGDEDFFFRMWCLFVLTQGAIVCIAKLLEGVAALRRTRGIFSGCFCQHSGCCLKIISIVVEEEL